MKTLKIGIIDLIARQPTKSIYARLVNPNYTSFMPQVIAVWLEKMGHEIHYVTYTGFEDLQREVPRELDLLFISTFTQNAYTAYAISNLYRKKGVITVLGGPHARAFAQDARFYFDYVLGLTDEKVIRDLIEDLSHYPEEGRLMSAPRQLEEIPTLQERWKYIQKNLDKTRLIHVIPMIGSLGCPYTCEFCIDSKIDYKPLSSDRLRADLSFLQSQPNPPVVAWYDPNFGVRFDEYLDLIESTVPPGRVAFGGESSLSLLSEDHLKRLKKNNFIVMLPGIESWFDFNAKSKQGKNNGLEKVKQVAAQINMALSYIPYVQTNHIFGLDADEGPEPFELTKRYIDLAPGVYTTYMLITSYGNSAPLSLRYLDEGRILDLPYPFLDGSSGLNVRLKNYPITKFYSYMSDLARYSFTGKRVWKRFQANKHPLPRWMNLMRSTLSGKGRGGNYDEIRNRYETDPDFMAFYHGETRKLPSYYHERVPSLVGPFFEHLPQRVLNYLKQGESHQNNPRLTAEENSFPLPALEYR
ncbi:MAG: radical SAM protein [Deltaproteobacteria bacterium]|nr:radical SAM protein [Deltaproteobacteria bacterium]